MKHYMLFIREDLAALQQMSEKQLQEEIQLMMQWGKTLSKSGHYIQGDPLEPEVRVARKERHNFRRAFYRGEKGG